MAARRFAAALGLIAFVFVVGFGLWQGSQLEWVLLRALIALILFAALGYVLGFIGAAVANDSARSEVKRRIEEEKAAAEGRKSEQGRTG